MSSCSRLTLFGHENTKSKPETGASRFGVLVSAAAVGAGLELADPVIGLVIALVVLHITWESWQTISRRAPGR